MLQLEALTALREGRYRRFFGITINTSGTEMKGQPAPNHWLARSPGRWWWWVCVCTLVMSIAGVRGREKEAREGLLGAVRLAHTTTSRLQSTMRLSTPADANLQYTYCFAD